MKKSFKVLGWTTLTLVLLVVVFIGFVLLRSGKTFDAPYPEIKASNDPAVIERGRYLAYGFAHCAACHVPMDKSMAVDNGLEIPLSGGWEETIPSGKQPIL